MTIRHCSIAAVLLLGTANTAYSDPAADVNSSRLQVHVRCNIKPFLRVEGEFWVWVFISLVKCFCATLS